MFLQRLVLLYTAANQAPQLIHAARRKKVSKRSAAAEADGEAYGNICCCRPGRCPPNDNDKGEDIIGHRDEAFCCDTFPYYGKDNKCKKHQGTTTPANTPDHLALGQIDERLATMYDEETCKTLFAIFDLDDRKIGRHLLYHASVKVDLEDPKTGTTTSWTVEARTGPLLRRFQPGVESGYRLHKLFYASTVEGRAPSIMKNKPYVDAELRLLDGVTLADFVEGAMSNFGNSMSSDEHLLKRGRHEESPWDPAFYNCQHFILDVVQVFAPKAADFYRMGLMSDGYAITYAHKKRGKFMTQIGADVSNWFMGKAPCSDLENGPCPLADFQKINGLTGNEVIKSATVFWEDATVYGWILTNRLVRFTDNIRRFEALQRLEAKPRRTILLAPSTRDSLCCCMLDACPSDMGVPENGFSITSGGSQHCCKPEDMTRFSPLGRWCWQGKYTMSLQEIRPQWLDQHNVFTCEVDPMVVPRSPTAQGDNATTHGGNASTPGDESSMTATTKKKLGWKRFKQVFSRARDALSRRSRTPRERSFEREAEFPEATDASVFVYARDNES